MSLARPSWGFVGALGLAACGGGGAEGALEASPSRLDFGPVAVGTAASVELRLIASGATPVVVERIAPDDLLAEVIQVVDPPSVLPPNTETPVQVVFQPNRAGPWLGDLEVTPEPESGVDPLRVEVTASGLASQIAVTPSEIDFGRVRIGHTATAAATVENVGLQSAEVRLGVTSAVAGGLGFSVGLDVRATLEPRDRIEVPVYFSPVQDGSQVATLVASGPDGSGAPQQVRLRGDGADSTFELEPSRVSFAGVLVGELRTRVVRVRNLGFENERAVSAEIPAPGRAFGFSVDGFEPAELAPGGALDLEVSFAPSEEGEASSRVVLQFESGERVLLGLEGRAAGRTVPRVRLPGGILDFGEVTVGHVTERQRWVVVEPGPALASSEPREIEPAGTGFELVGAAEQIPGGQHARLGVEFRPGRLGPVEATLRVGTATAGLRARVVGEPVGELAPVPARVDFGRVPRGFESVRRIALRSAGLVGVEGLEAVTEGPFSIVGSAPPDLPRGRVADLWVAFLDRETFAGPRTGRVVLRAPGGPVQLAIPLEAEVRPLPVPEPWLEVGLEWEEEVDLDLHLVLGDADVFDAPGDACFCNPQPDWGVVGAVEDDPWLAVDAARGPAREAIRIDNPTGSAFRVEVVHRGGAPAEARVDVRVNGAQVGEAALRLGAQTRWTVGMIRLSVPAVPTLSLESAPLVRETRTACK